MIGFSYIKENWKKVLVTLSIFCVLVILTSFIGCLIKFFIGVPCPGCGISRACFRVLHLDFIGAFKYHPLFWFMPPFVFLYIFTSGNYTKKKSVNRTITWLSVALIFGVYIYRMVCFFPDTSPMDYNGNSVINNIIKFLKENLL